MTVLAMGGLALGGLALGGCDRGARDAVPADVHAGGDSAGGRADAVPGPGELREALERARRNGGTPIALVEEETALRRRPGGDKLARLGTETEFGSPRVLAVVGREDDWLEVMSADLDNGETGFVRAADVDLGGTDYSLRASLAERTLEVHRNGEVLRSVPVAIGGPATPTPTGKFAVTDKLRMIDAESIYGCCALAFTGHQPNVPQGWTGGDRLAVHATLHEATIGQEASLGCFRAAEDDMRWLVDEVPLGTVVTIGP